MSQCVFSSRFEKGRLLSQVSTLGIGGPARFFLEVHTAQELKEALLYCHTTSLPFFILGKGSNSLFDDRGFNGLVIANKIAFCDLSFPFIRVGAGYSFSLLGTQTARAGWSGLEFASGIPGTVGGAIYMNAGANGKEVSSVIKEVSYITAQGEEVLLKNEELSFSYRFSSFQEKTGAIASALFELVPSEQARQKQLEIIDYRTKTQPYSDKSAGCIFRNPSSGSAGALIEKSGLKGQRIGGAEVSTIHANFIVNKGGATAQDVLSLARLVSQVVKDKTGVELIREVRCIPFELGDDVSG